MRTAIYARTSTSGQEEKQTIQQQVLACRGYCDQHGYHVVAEFLDDGVSGAIPFDERPQGARLLAQAKTFDRVVIYCPDRLGRDTVEGIIAYDTIRKSIGMAPDFVSQSFDATPEGEFTFTVFMAVAKLERAVIARRMGRGKLAKVMAGQFLTSKVPWGYNLDRTTKTLSVNEEQARWVRFIFEQVVTRGTKAVAADLRSKGVPTPGGGKAGWTFRTISKTVKNPLYKGQTLHHGVQQQQPEIVSEEQWQAANAALRRRTTVQRHPKRKPMLLTGMLTCRHCGNKYRSRDRNTYACRQRNDEPGRDLHEGVIWKFPVKVVEGKVIALVKRFMEDPANAMKQAQVYVERKESQLRVHQAELELLTRRVEELTKAEEKMLEGWEEGIYPDAKQFKARLQHTRDELEAAQQKLADFKRVELSSEQLHAMAQERMEWLQTLSTGFGIKGSPAGRDLVKRLVDVVWVEPDGTLTVEGVLHDKAAAQEDHAS